MRFPGVCDGKGILWPVILSFLFLAAGCGGGGTGTSTGSLGTPVGPAAVDIAFVANTESGTSASSMSMAVADPAYKPVSDFFEIKHVYMEIVKISLLPAEETGFDGEDMEGEMREDDRDDTHLWPKEKPGFVTLIPSSPTRIDLVKLEKGKQLARILNHFDSVPAGTYNKIRVHYRGVRVVLEDNSEVYFHPTAHSHFDIHFVAGKNLVIPATTDTAYPDNWVRFFKVKLDVVGLKIKVVVQGKSWKGAKVILRPQVFAEFLSPVQYGVAGVVTRVFEGNTSARGDFDIAIIDGTEYLVTFYDDATSWAYSDNVLEHSRWEVAPVTNAISSGAMRNGAIVEAVGRFLTGTMDLKAKEITITFPDVSEGEVDNGWSLDNTFVLRSPADSVVVPQPDRSNTYYDNLVSPYEELNHTHIDNNVKVKARGYLVPDPAPDTRRIEAYWISIGP
ncbi:MAG: hypothetical protein OEM42_06715 [Deltaproteobacteria bacterium]|nr:hypothetical protein [Deltaproteobacteria bacterium]